MTNRREMEGIGYHYSEHDIDCLLVDRWLKRPDDLKGQSLTIIKLLPKEFRCANPLNYHGGGYPGNPPPRKFRFQIIIKIDNLVLEDKQNLIH